ncbi:MAG: hypothetical protein ACC700_18520 [Anaerolineales bacterium]
MAVSEYRLNPHEITSSACSCVLIDDTGTPGQNAGSVYLDESRKTWTAVFTSPKQISELIDQIPKGLRELEEQTGATEFHFAEIFGGSGQFAGVDPLIRLAIFEFMQEVFDEYGFAVLVQTLDDFGIAEVRNRMPFPEHVTEFNLTKPADFALLLLLFQIRRFLGDHSSGYPSPAYVVMDEGFRKADRAVTIPTFEQSFQRSSIVTAKSIDFPPLQLADYAAFCVGKSQWLLTKENRSLFDLKVFDIMSGLTSQVINLPASSIDPESWTIEDYESFIDADRAEKGLGSRGEDD